MFGQLLTSAVGTVANAKRCSQEARIRNQIVQSVASRSAHIRSRYSRNAVEQEIMLAPERVLGTGCSGAVIMAVERHSGSELAVKTYRKQELTLTRLHSLQSEVNIYLTLDHPHIVQLYKVYESNDTVQLCMELCSGGELYGRLKQTKVFSEKNASRAAFQMLSAIEYLHKQRVVHRDIKLENWLYESDVDDAALKLADFGFATTWNGSEPMHESCGTLSYLAPEVFEERYTDKCDMWSFGVVMFALLNGRMPFEGKTEREIKDRILECEYTFLEGVSEEAQDFIERLLVRNPAKRMSAAESLTHPWIVRHVSGNTMYELVQDSVDLKPFLTNRTRSAMEHVQWIPLKVACGGA